MELGPSAANCIHFIGTYEFVDICKIHTMAKVLTQTKKREGEKLNETKQKKRVNFWLTYSTYSAHNLGRRGTIIYSGDGALEGRSGGCQEGCVPWLGRSWFPAEWRTVLIAGIK